MLVGAGHHQHVVAGHPLVAGEDVGRDPEAGDVADVPGAVGVGPGDCCQYGRAHSDQVSGPPWIARSRQAHSSASPARTPPTARINFRSADQLVPDGATSVTQRRRVRAALGPWTTCPHCTATLVHTCSRSERSAGRPRRGSSVRWRILGAIDVRPSELFQRWGPVIHLRDADASGVGSAGIASTSATRIGATRSGSHRPSRRPRVGSRQRSGADSASRSIGFGLCSADDAHRSPVRAAARPVGTCRCSRELGRPASRCHAPAGNPQQRFPGYPSDPTTRTGIRPRRLPATGSLGQLRARVRTVDACVTRAVDIGPRPSVLLDRPGQRLDAALQRRDEPARGDGSHHAVRRRR